MNGARAQRLRRTRRKVNHGLPCRRKRGHEGVCVRGSGISWLHAGALRGSAAAHRASYIHGIDGYSAALLPHYYIGIDIYYMYMRYIYIYFCWRKGLHTKSILGNARIYEYRMKKKLIKRALGLFPVSPSVNSRTWTHPYIYIYCRPPRAPRKFLFTDAGSVAACAIWSCLQARSRESSQEKRIRPLRNNYGNKSPVQSR